MATAQADTTYRRAVVLMTATSFLVPAVGLVTAPILAHALSVQGRGELAAALAPAGLMLAVATMGLPDAMTFFTAKRPEVTRRAVTWASLMTFGLGLACVVIVLAVLPFLRGGDIHLGRLILLASGFTIPALVIGVVRGAAIGNQMWRAVAAERLISTAGRLVAFVGLYVTGNLTVINAVLVNVLLPIVAGVVYVALWKSASPANAEIGALAPLDAKPVYEANSTPSDLHSIDTASASDVLDARLRTIVAFGTRIWFGSVASMLLDRLSPLLMVPLSSVADLGIYTVANNVADLPLIVALAIAGALYGANSKSTNVDQITNTSRLSLLACLVGFVVLAGTIGFWIGPVFGSEFKGAATPTLLRTAGSLICIPGLMAGAGLAAWGRPGLRSLGLVVTLVVNILLFVILVPRYGVYGACWTSIVSSFVLSAMMVSSFCRVVGVPASKFIVIRGSDVGRLVSESRQIVQRLFDRLARSR